MCSENWSRFVDLEPGNSGSPIRMGLHVHTFASEELVEVRIHQGQLSKTRFRLGAHGHYGFFGEQIDGIAYLLRSDQADDRPYRERLVQRLLSLHYAQSMRVRDMVPELYFHGLRKT
jgi:hypothetical protein